MWWHWQKNRNMYIYIYPCLAFLYCYYYYVVEVYFLDSHARILLGVPQIFLSAGRLRCQVKLGDTALNDSFCAYEVITVAAGLISKIVPMNE
jgi:hypothetical protein